MSGPDRSPPALAGSPVPFALPFRHSLPLSTPLPMTRLQRPTFWLPLLLAAGTVLIAPLLPGQDPPLQRHALALLISLTVALSGYLFTAMVRPERF